jgi:mannose-1-phosphate guanylyltransferase/mannose-6-phosphate isomerase
LEDLGCVRPLIVTNEEHRFIAAEQLKELGSKGHLLVVEPEGRNTAAAIAAVVEIVAAEDPNTILLVAPSDHHFADELALGEAIAQGARVARQGAIVTFGISPAGPETGYGYIELAGAGDENGPVPFVRFTEKPSPSEAKALIATGRHVWNSGMFMFQARAAREVLSRHASEVLAAASQGVRSSTRDGDYLLLGQEFATAPSLSFDKAVMELVSGYVVPLATAWNDLGSWRSVWEESSRDESGVALYGDALAMDCSNSLLRSTEEGLKIVGIGLRNIAAVATRDAVLITSLNTTQDVAEVVDKMTAAGERQATEFSRQARPWGHYETLALGSRYQVKSIVVNPGGTLSLQSHVHRAEHWVVVEGSAKVTIGRSVRLVGENQSVFVPLGEVHRLANPGKVPLRLIEVQTGAYLGEDDIVRYQDDYARALG